MSRSQRLVGNTVHSQTIAKEVQSLSPLTGELSADLSADEQMIETKNRVVADTLSSIKSFKRNSDQHAAVVKGQKILKIGALPTGSILSMISDGVVNQKDNNVADAEIQVAIQDYAFAYAALLGTMLPEIDAITIYRHEKCPQTNSKDHPKESDVNLFYIGVDQSSIKKLHDAATQYQVEQAAPAPAP